MSYIALSIGAYVVLIWLPVDWVLTTELAEIVKYDYHWLRQAVLSTTRTRIRKVDQLTYVIEAKAMFITPWRLVKHARNQIGVYSTLTYAEQHLEEINQSIRKALNKV